MTTCDYFDTVVQYFVKNLQIGDLRTGTTKKFADLR
jgi:hypothetical protein